MNLLLPILFFLAGSRDSLPNETLRPGFKKYYDAFQLGGTFALYSAHKKNTIVYNRALIGQPSTPASTFNILLTLIGLKEDIIKNENSVIRESGPVTDSFYRPDMTLRQAFTGNYESYFRRLSKRISPEKIQSWLRRVHYGNANSTAHPNDFWLGESLRITPAQQLSFIEDFYYERLPFSKEEFSLVKKLMAEGDSAGCKVYGKRGSYKLPAEKKYIGWFVGYIETPDDTLFFVNYIESPDMAHPRLVDAQKEIPFTIFRDLGLPSFQKSPVHDK